MLGYIIYDRAAALQNIGYIQMYTDKFKKRGIEIKLVYADELWEKALPDFAIVRIISPEITGSLEKKGVRCFNNYKVSYITNDKALTYKYVNDRGIRIMDTFCTADDVNSFPVVIKPKSSHGGDRVFMVGSYDELEKKLKLYEDGSYVVQKTASELGKDLRVYVIGNDIVCSMLRESDNDFRSNFCLGGRASVYELSESEKKLVGSVMELFDFDFVGIDFVFDKGRMVFNEIEDVVGSRMVYSCTDIDIVELYVEHICKALCI